MGRWGDGAFSFTMNPRFPVNNAMLGREKATQHTGEGLDPPVETCDRDPLVVSVEEGGKVELGGELERVESVALGTEAGVVATVGKSGNDGGNDMPGGIGGAQGAFDLAIKCGIGGEGDGG